MKRSEDCSNLSRSKESQINNPTDKKVKRWTNFEINSRKSSTFKYKT